MRISCKKRQRQIKMEGNKQGKNKKRTVKETDMKKHSIFVCDSAVGATSVTRVTGAQPPSSTCKAGGGG